MKILIVDDEPIANFITIRLLNHINSEFEIAEYTEPLKAIGSVAAENPDLILLDLNMPDMNGWGFLDKMTADNLPHKVFILSSSLSAVDRERAARYPQVLKCLIKPISKDNLRESIAEFF